VIILLQANNINTCDVIRLLSLALEIGIRF